MLRSSSCVPHGGLGPVRKFFSLMSDPLPYGMAANSPSIEALITYSLQQKLIPSRPQLDQVFVDIDP
jgi:4,5-dihydroxyphthalate decarboxylase